MEEKPEDLTRRLRLAAEYKMGDDLLGRIEYASSWQAKQRVALNDAADVIDAFANGGTPASSEPQAPPIKRIHLTAEMMKQNHPDILAPVENEFFDSYLENVSNGLSIAKKSKVVFVGMARSIDGELPNTIERISESGKQFVDWKVVVFENDSEDGTKELLKTWQDEEEPGRIHISLNDFGFEHLNGWEPLRVERYARYRNECRQMAAMIMPDADFVVVMDLDPWGGHSRRGLLNSVSWLDRIPNAGCMASVSLYQIRDNEGNVHLCHYDQWGFRSLQSWSHRIESWFTRWIPATGSNPILVKSAFGGLAVYKAAPFFASEYQGGPDIEHVGLHKSMKANGYDVYLNPSSRVTMEWALDEQEKTDADIL